MNHCGNMGDTTANGTADLYREVVLDLPTTARVNKDITPSVHILADFNQYLSGKTLTLDTSNNMAMGSSAFGKCQQQPYQYVQSRPRSQ
jgi:hypothetical protein